MSASTQIHGFRKGLTLDAADPFFPSSLLCVEREEIVLEQEGTHFFGFVLEGEAHLAHAGRAFNLPSGMFFSVPSSPSLRADGRVVLWLRHGYLGPALFGGPVEAYGRLAYIDSCTTNILVPPPRLPDPVLNALYFPPGTKQTMHLHPTPRLGVVYAGEGRCVAPGEPDRAIGRGSVFFIPAGARHCFHTGGSAMSLIAFHPDSDTGPADDDHPMLNRTYLRP